MQTLPQIKPMKMTDIPVTDVELYLVNPDWVLEQKHDGARALVTWDSAVPDAFIWQASGGGPLKFAAAAQHMGDIAETLRKLFMLENVDKIILDGELIVEEGELRVFDVAYLEYNSDLGPEVVTDTDFDRRRLALEELFEHHTDLENVRLAYQAVTEDEKRALWAMINAEGVEGGMVKHRDGRYEPGVRTKTQLKLKLVKTADVIVTSVERKFDHKGMVTHGSAGLAVNIRFEQDPRPFRSQVTDKRITTEELRELKNSTSKAKQARALAFVYDPRGTLPVGAASLIGKDLTIDVGDVVEVNYLYWGGEALVQPRIVRKRLPEEKPSDDCWIDQIPAYSRRAVR